MLDRLVSMRPFAVIKNVTAQFLIRNHLTLIAAPSLLSFVTALHSNPQSPLHPSLAIAALLFFTCS